MAESDTHPVPAISLPIALTHHQAGRLDEAEALYRALLTQAPDNADALHLLGVLLAQRAAGDLEGLAQGAALVRRALTSPAFAQSAAGGGDARANLARILGAMARRHEAQGARDRALEAWMEALDLTPDDDAARHGVADGLAWVGAWAAAEGEYRALLARHPGDTTARLGLARTLLARRQATAALTVLDALTPDDTAQTATAALLRVAGEASRWEEHGNRAAALDAAAQALEKARAAGAPAADLARWGGHLARRRGRIGEARQFYAQALTLAPEDAATRVAYAHASLRLGIWRDGFAELPWRWMLPGATRRHGHIPYWTGPAASHPGHTLLVWDEEEEAALPHVLPLLDPLLALGLRVDLEVPPGFAPLVPQRPGLRLLPRGEGEMRADFQAPLQELPGLLDLAGQGGPRAGAGFLRIPVPNPSAPDAPPGPPRVGLVAGDDPALAAVLEDVALALRQRGVTALPLPAAPQAGDWAGLAHQLVGVGAVLAAAGTTAHLAGALGRPGVVAVPLDAAWSWPADGDASPWHTSLTLLHQRSPDDWRDAGAWPDIADHLAALAHGGAAAQTCPPGEWAP